MKKFLDLIYYFDESVDILNWKFKVNHAKDRMKLIICFVVDLLASAAMIFLLLITYTSTSAEVLREIYYSCFVVSTQILVLLQFIFSSGAVKLRYKILTKNMRSKFPQIELGTQIMKVESDDRIHFIKKTAWLHDTLYEALTEINAIFSTQIVFVLFATLISQVFSCYFFFQTFKKEVVDDETMKAVSCTFLYLVWQTTPVGLAIYYASKTIECGKEMTSVVGKIINICDEKAILDRLKLFSMQMHGHQPVLSCGFFPIDYTLAFLITGSITTYLVILCQFETTTSV
ncbi:unnamed protein product [Diamesa hyperborea]